MKINLTAEFYLIDTDGTSRCVACKDADLFVGNFVLEFQFWFTAATGIYVTKTDGTTFSLSLSYYWDLKAPSGNTTYGPMVGTGITTPQITNYTLGAKIAHGTGSGQLVYGATAMPNPATSGSSRFWNVSRSFTNSSGASITVNEIGLVAKTSSYYFMIARDVLGTGVAIANGQVGTLNYKFQVSV